jgi:hypothetical protein
MCDDCDGYSPAIEPKPPMIEKRCVFHIIGYEPLVPERIHRRFERGLESFRQTWNATATQSPPVASGPVVAWQINSAGADWQVATEVVLFDWSDIVLADFARPRWRIILRGFSAIFDFAFSRAAAGYLRTNWRYLLFFIYPMLLLALFAVVSYLAAILAVAAGVPSPEWFGPLIGVAAFVLLLHLVGPKLYLDFVLCDWSFAADLVRRRRPDLDARLERLTAEFAERVRRFDGDEIIVFSHSFGAVIMLLVVARALRKDPLLARRGFGINLVSAGSSLLKIGLHRSASDLRNAVRDVIEEPAIFWAEFQALVDPVNFYKTDPVVEMGLPACGKPIVRIVRIRDMLSAESYRRMRGQFFRIHRQFVLGNERRYFYDFFMMCCGPLPLQEWVTRPELALAKFSETSAPAVSPVESVPLIKTGPP